MRGFREVASDPPLPLSEAKNLSNDPVGVLKNPLIGKTEDCEALTAKICIPFSVPSHALFVSVDLSIQLDQQPDLVATEVRNKWADGELPTEFQASQPTIPERTPHRDLGRRLSLPQNLGQIAHRGPPTLCSKS